MATETTADASSMASILGRLIRPERDDLPEDGARALLQLGFDQADLDRMQDLLARNQAETLTDRDREELENYRRVSYLLDLMHSKARRSLKRRGVAP